MLIILKYVYLLSYIGFNIYKNQFDGKKSMIFQDFWTISFWDIVILSVSIILFIASKYYDKYREKKHVKFLFLRIKKLFKTVLKKDTEEKFLADLPFLKTELKNLIKIGVIPRIGESTQRTVLNIVDKYIFTGIELILMDNQRLQISKENFEMILHAMINFANINFKIKLSEKLSKFDF